MTRDTTQPTEDAESIALAKWLTSAGLLFTHVANGKGRTDIEGKLLQRMGVQAGFPDYLVFAEPRRLSVSHHIGVALELKKRKGGTTRKNQSAWLLRLSKLGWFGPVAALAWIYNVQLPVPICPVPPMLVFVSGPIPKDLFWGTR